MDHTQVQLFETPLSLVSIPRLAYPYFTQGILKLIYGLWRDELLFHGTDRRRSSGSGSGPSPSDASSRKKRHSRSEDNSNISSPVTASPTIFEAFHDRYAALEDFINVSFTPLECSIICPAVLIDMLFGDQLARLGKSLGVQVLHGQYLAIKVDSDGQDIGASVLAISKPLSSAGVPIFFIATYFSDFVLVPVNARATVSKVLESKGFVFSDTANSYVVDSRESEGIGHDASSTAAGLEGNDANARPQLSPGDVPHPDTPASLRKLFDEHSVSPQVDSSTKLLLTGARSTSVETPDLQLSVTKVLLSPPKYFSLTKSSGSEVSFLIDDRTSSWFPAHSLLGSPTDFVYPILFDLRHVPQDATGIVAGVADMITLQGGSSVHLRYISTALSGLALVGEDDFDTALTVFGNSA